MFKKIIIGAILIGVVGFLVFGAVNRTMAKTSGSSLVTYYPSTGSYSHLESSGGDNQFRGNRQGENENRTYNRNNNESESRENRPRNGKPDADETFIPGEGQANATEYTELDGIVSAVDDLSLLITTSDGQTIEVYGRAWTYAQEMGFTAAEGDSLHLIGFYDTNQVFEVSQMTNLNNNQTVSLRSENGRPNWAGGNGNGNRGGR